MLAMIAGYIKKDEKRLFADGYIFIRERRFIELVKSKSGNSRGWCLSISFKR
jgi:hypothetical protein